MQLDRTEEQFVLLFSHSTVLKMNLWLHYYVGLLYIFSR